MARSLHSLPLVFIALLIAACAPAPSATAPGGAAPAVSQPSGPKKIVAAIRSAPASMSKQKTNPPGLVGSVPGLDALEELVHTGLTHNAPDGSWQPVLAEQTPSIENGLWRLFPDGRMETTWRIRSDARWHDGAPVTTDDLLFTMMVEQDLDVGIPRNSAYDLIDTIAAADATTITVSWKRPFIEADATFSYPLALPMPRHLLEKPFNDDKANFLGIPYWTEAFVGAGPYRIRDWVTDSHVIAQAFDGYVLGKPKIDEVEVRFIPDPNVLMANVLAGVELTLGRTISLDQALQLRDQWRDGAYQTRPTGWVPINAQFINPDPPVVTDYRFRKAMLEAIDRKVLDDTIMGGSGGTADTFISPDHPEYRAIENRLTKYNYDPRSAAQTLESLGYGKGSDGMLLDATGQHLTVSIYTTIQNDIHPKATAAVADFWKAVGVGVDQNIIPIQRAQDREYRAQFPTFELVQTGSSLSARDVRRFHSSSTPLPENRFTISGNNSRYRNPELDAAIDRYLTAIPRDERTDALGGIARIQSANLPILPLIFFVSPTMIANRLTNIVARGDQFTEAWNAHEWDTR